MFTQNLRMRSYLDMGFGRCNYSRWGHIKTMVGPKSNDWSPYKKAIWRQRKRLGDVSTSQGMPRVAGSHHKPRERQGTYRFPLRTSRRKEPCLHFDSGLLGSRTGREEISVVLSHQVYGCVIATTGNIREIDCSEEKGCWDWVEVTGGTPGSWLGQHPDGRWQNGQLHK